LQNSPLESSCVVVALTENYSTSNPLKVSLKKSVILSCDTVVANERYLNTSKDIFSQKIPNATNIFCNIHLDVCYISNCFQCHLLDELGVMNEKAK
jgi:hypothetical protein